MKNSAPNGRIKNQIELSEAREYLVSLAPQAGAILRRHFVERDYTLRKKEGVDFVTQADEEVDVFLREKVKEHYPHAQFLTEETAPQDYSALKNAENLWVIDPLDGTTNFSRGDPYFSISLALVDKGTPRLGVVHFPVAGDIYWAQEDKDGAYRNGERITVSSISDMKESVLAYDWAWGLERRHKIIQWLGKTIAEVRALKTMGSSVANLANLAEGKLDAFMHSGLKPWDVAAGALLIEKAGGKVTTPAGARFDVFQPEILATNRLLHNRMIELVNNRE